MDNRDEIIRTQLDVISTLINNNLRNIGNDLWGDHLPDKPADNSRRRPQPPKESRSAKKPEAAAAPQQEDERSRRPRTSRI